MPEFEEGSACTFTPGCTGKVHATQAIDAVRYHCDACACQSVEETPKPAEKPALRATTPDSRQLNVKPPLGDQL